MAWNSSYSVSAQRLSTGKGRSSAGYVWLSILASLYSLARPLNYYNSLNHVVRTTYFAQWSSDV